MPLYFAYGSNMSPGQMQRRCPGARPVGHAWATDWRFVIPARRGASIVPTAGATVHGVLWRVEPWHVCELDCWEGVSVGAYRRHRITVRTETREFSTLVYLSDKRWPGRARPDYMLTAILPGAAAFNLPADYREELASWLGPRPIGPVRQVYRGRRTRKRSR